jgi:site-specific recombinase XerD
MIPFKSPLADLIRQYIDYRKSLGYRDKALPGQLLVLDRIIAYQDIGLQDLTPSFFLDIRLSYKDRPDTFNAMLLGMRGFLNYLTRCQVICYNPLTDITAYPQNAFIPFVFSPEQINQMMIHIQNTIPRDPDHFLAGYSIYVAILLLARCGMRISEPLRLTLSHYNPRGTLYIEKTKFSKDRLIPVPVAVKQEIDNYLAARKSLVKTENPYLLPGQNERALSKKAVYKVFDSAVSHIGIHQPKQIIANTTFAGPTPHSLRHSFAINTLKSIREKGQSPQNALPVLSIYMGHCKYRYTAVYLKVLDAEHRQSLVDFAIARQEEL